MGIVADDIARVRAASDIVAIVSEHVGLKKVGQRWQGLCPFHSEKTASFSVNAQENLWHCFGCSKGGDVITFVRQIDHLDFVDAVERLASRAGIQLHYDDDAATSPDRQRRTRLLDVMARAVDWYHERLLSAADAATARGYLRSRGYDGEVVRQYRLGWAPDGWDALASFLKLPDDVLRDSGLGFVNRRGRQQDAFRSRLLFPIFDARGDAVAFGGRTLPGGEGPKYKNSQETPLYSKSKILYGLNWAKADIVQRGEVVVCEGYTDVIGLDLAGVRRAVATCGTALAEDHFRLLKNFARRVVLAYDADAAGQAAAERFYEWEKRYELDLAVAALPAGADPADVAQRDPGALQRAVAEAQPFLAFRLERALGSADLRTPEGRARAAEAALVVIAEHPDELVRDQYVMQVADRCRLDAGILRARLEPGARTSSLQTVAVDPVELPSGPETEALKLAIHRPDEAGHLHEVLFHDERCRAAFIALSTAPNLVEAVARADPPVASLLQRLAVEEFDADPDDVVGRLVREAAWRARVSIQTDMRQAEDPLQYTEANEWLSRLIHRSDLGVEAANVLVPWLLDRLQVEA